MRFPKNLYVKIEHDPRDKTIAWPLCDTHMSELVGMGCTEKIAIYQLVEVREATGVVSHRKVK